MMKEQSLTALEFSAANQITCDLVDNHFRPLLFLLYIKSFQEMVLAAFFFSPLVMVDLFASSW